MSFLEAFERRLKPSFVNIDTLHQYRKYGTTEMGWVSINGYV